MPIQSHEAAAVRVLGSATVRCPDRGAWHHATATGCTAANHVAVVPK